MPGGYKRPSLRQEPPYHSRGRGPHFPIGRRHSPTGIGRHFAILAYESHWLGDFFMVTALTDNEVHLFMRFTEVPPGVHNTQETKRGLLMNLDPKFCFTTYTDIEQQEPGDTLDHTWEVPAWPICETRWWYFIGTKGGNPSPSAGPILSEHHAPPVMVLSLGIYPLLPVLTGHVKLEAGDNITLAYDLPNNAIAISSG